MSQMSVARCRKLSHRGYALEGKRQQDVDHQRGDEARDAPHHGRIEQIVVPGDFRPLHHLGDQGNEHTAAEQADEIGQQQMASSQSTRCMTVMESSART